MIAKPLSIATCLCSLVIFGSAIENCNANTDPENRISSEPGSQKIADDIVAYARKNDYNGAILIERHGKVILRKYCGVANREFGIPNGPGTRFKLDSITKLFTSVLIMRLRDKGLLDVNQPIRQYIPDYHGEGASKVTIYDLLTATSGIEDFGTGDPRAYLVPETSDELLTKYSSGKLTKQPGSEFNYNNADYVILGKVVEHVSGKPFELALKDFILDPLHLQDSGMCEGQTVDRLASTYSWDPVKGIPVADAPYAIQNFYAAGAMYSTVNDLAKFSDALFGGKLLKPDSLNLLLKPNLADYACGLWVSDYNVNGSPLRVAERQGSIWNTTNRLLRFFDKDVTVILLTNMGSTNLDRMQLEIMSKFMPGVGLPEFEVAASPSRADAAVDSTVDLTITVKNIGAKTSGNLIDVKVTDVSGSKQDQLIKPDVAFVEGGSVQLDYHWKPKAPGAYKVSVGIYQSGWRENYLTASSVATINVK